MRRRDVELLASRFQRAEQGNVALEEVALPWIDSRFEGERRGSSLGVRRRLLGSEK